MAEFSTFPANDTPGLRVRVPTAEYMLALKLKAISRVLDPAKGPQETKDIQNLLRATETKSIDEAISIMGKYFPRSAADDDKHRFLLNHIWPKEAADETPTYPVLGR